MQKKQKLQPSWFWRWFLNSQVVTGLLVVLLCLLIVMVFSKVSYIFEPVGQFFSVVGLPIILAGVLYYLFNPIIDFLERHRIKRVYGIIGLFVVLIGLIVWGIVVIVPAIQNQLMLFAKNFPNYVNTINEKGNEILRSDFFDQFRDQIENSLQKAMTSAIDLVQNISSSTIRGVGNIVAALANIIIAIITAPIILFFLLKDGCHVSGYFVKFLPNRMRKPTQKVLTEMNDQVASYIRGQLTVAIAVAIMFVFGFSMINLEFAVTIGVMAGFLNLIPYLGSFLAMLPAIFIALVADPMMLFKVLIVFIIEQTIEGRLISPLVLGSQLKMHPVTILLVLLSSGKIFGVAGVILGIPIYAAVKVIVTHVFEWYRSISSLYEEDRQAEEPEPPDTVADSDDDLES